MKKIKYWVSQVMLLKKTLDPENTKAIQSQIASMKQNESIAKLIGNAYTHIIASQLRSYTTILTGQQTFQQLTATNLIKSKIQKDGVIVDSFMPRIKAPPSTVKHIAHHLRIRHLDQEMDCEGFQSLSEFIGELDGFYDFYQTQRYRLLSEKSNDSKNKPLFYGQHKQHWEFETKPYNAISMLNNQQVPSLTHKGSLDVEKTNAYLGEQEFNRGRKGLKKLYIQGLKAKFATNFIQYNHWKEKNFKDINWSQTIKDDFEKLFNDVYTAKHVINAINIDGFYHIPDYSDSIFEIVESHVKKHELRFSSKPVWKSHYHEILFHHLMTKPSNWKLNKKHLKEISKLFRGMFTDEFLIRRCSEWRFYLHD